MRLLKTNTAIRISVGPFVDYETGDPEIALTVTNTICEMYITPNDGSAVTRTAITLTASGGNNDMVHIADDIGGYYELELTQSQTNFLGRMRLCFTDADVHMSLWEDFLVVPANVFDAVVTGTDYLDAAIVEQANIDFGALQKASLNAATPASVTTVTGNVNGSVDSVTDAVSVGSIATDVITAASIKTDAVTKINNGAAVSNGTAQGSAANFIRLAATEPATDDYYNGCLVVIVSGTGAGQARLISDYVASGNYGVVDWPWITAPDTTSLYRIYPFSGILLADTGVAMAVSANTITLSASASGIADTYIGHTIYISGGAGAGQARLITGYTSGRIVTVRAWTTALLAYPDSNLSIYKILPVGRVYVNEIAPGAITASALATDAVTEITDAIKAITIDGAITLLKALKIRLAKDIGSVIVDGNTIKYYDQAGVLLLTDPITITGSTRVVA